MENTMNKIVLVNKNKKLFFQRKTSRYAPVGTFSSNQGYLAVKHAKNGRFISQGNFKD
jgi:hypothetical protein